MKVYMKEVILSTKKRMEVIKITEHVNQAVKESGISDGVVIVHAPHATVAILINEFEPRLTEDYVEWVRKYVPVGVGWKHDEIDDNAYAHIASAIIGPSRIIPLSRGRLLLGTWQDIMLLELDGPRSMRRIVIQVMGN
ncbi:MAG: secondary thiamine-phosphate synthase enzyme YjbQ [Sulfolobales archaeon]